MILIGAGLTVYWPFGILVALDHILIAVIAALIRYGSKRAYVCVRIAAKNARVVSAQSMECIDGVMQNTSHVGLCFAEDIPRSKTPFNTMATLTRSSIQMLTKVNMNGAPFANVCATFIGPENLSVNT